MLGFKPIASLKPHHNLREPTMLYPDEKRMPGSTPAFIALHGQVRSTSAFIAMRGQLHPRVATPPVSTTFTILLPVLPCLASLPGVCCACAVAL